MTINDRFPSNQQLTKPKTSNPQNSKNRNFKNTKNQNINFKNKNPNHKFKNKDTKTQKNKNSKQKKQQQQKNAPAARPLERPPVSWAQSCQIHAGYPHGRMTTISVRSDSRGPGGR